MLVHLDTDFAGDTDDAAALALLLGWPQVELTGITTVADPDGARAAYVERFLEIAGRGGIPVAAGAGRSLTDGEEMGGLPDHEAYWGAPPVSPQGTGDAMELLRASVERGATVVAIGPYTNLAVAEQASPGLLAETEVVLMGGWIWPAAEGLPPWGPEMDWNVQCDTDAAQIVVAAAPRPTLATLTSTVNSWVRAADLQRLESAGPIGALLARQARAHDAEHHRHRFGEQYEALPDDLLNFQYDPVAAAVAVGWKGVEIVDVKVRPVVEERVLRFEADDEGVAVRAVSKVDAEAFAERWLEAIEHI